MAVETLLSLVLFALVSTITPGAATTLATASGAHFGFRRSIPVMTGCASGLGFVACAAAAGLGSLLVALPALTVAMKTLGSLYLLWLAVRIARSGGPKLAARLVEPTGFFAGMWMLFYNPKGWAMAIGAAASFSAIAKGPATLAMVLGLTFFLVAACSLALWCVAGQLLGRLLRTERQWRALNLCLGFLLLMSIVPMWRG
jgi:threonine/homoserine/homoserine lactone efflux protein